MTGLPSSHKNAPKPPSGPVIGNSPARSSSAKKPTQPAAGEKPPTKVQQSPNKQAPASKDSLAEFRNSLSAREQTRKASREALKQQQNQKKLEQIEAADREREELLKTFKEQEREERKKKERERAEKEAKRKERELLEERNKEAEEMAAKRWQGVLLARVFKVMRSQASETKDRMFIAGHVHHTKRLRKMLVSIMCELRERLKPRIIDERPAVRQWETYRKKEAIRIWKLSMIEIQHERTIQMKAADTARKSSVLRAWQSVRTGLQRERWEQDKSNNSKVKRFRVRQLAGKVLHEWHEVVRDQIKQKMYEQDKTKYMSKVQDWLKEFEVQKQLQHPSN